MKNYIRRSWHWLLLFLLLDAAALFAVWIIRPAALVYLSLFLSLSSVIFLTAGIFLESRRDRKDAAALQRFLELPEEQTRARLLTYFAGNETVADLCNNGVRVPPEDEPLLFDKGFTGSYPNRQKATGMGLYLVRKYGQKLCVEARLSEKLPYESGFGIELIFTR